MERAQIIEKYGLKEHAAVRNPGAEIALNGEIITVPSLSIAQFMKHYQFLATGDKEISDAEVSEYYPKMIGVVGEAIRRNHPEITDEYLTMHLDLSTFKRCIFAVQNAPGIERSLEGYIA